MTLLCCNGLTRSPWFEGLDLDVDAGEVVALRGASGSGKSLFLRALADLDPVDGGRVELDGTDRSSIAPETWRRSVLYLHQGAPRLPGTVAQDLGRIANLLGRAPATETLGLDPRADTERLSGGEAQRLAVARALLVAPRVWLLDEATSALDEDGVGLVEGILRERVASGCALVWATHDPRIGERFGAREVRFP